MSGLISSQFERYCMLVGNTHGLVQNFASFLWNCHRLYHPIAIILVLISLFRVFDNGLTINMLDRFALENASGYIWNRHKSETVRSKVRQRAFVCDTPTCSIEDHFPGW